MRLRDIWPDSCARVTSDLTDMTRAAFLNVPTRLADLSYFENRKMICKILQDVKNDIASFASERKRILFPVHLGCKGYVAVTCEFTDWASFASDSTAAGTALGLNSLFAPQQEPYYNPQGKVLLLDVATKVKRQGLLCPNPSNS